jgi:hypothetical protein
MSILNDAEALANVPTPAGTQQALYLDSTTGLWTSKNSSGVGLPLAGSITAAALHGFLGGCGLSNDATSPNTVLDIAQGSCCSDDFTTMMTLASAFTKTTGSWAAGTGNGGLDTGTIGAASWYHVYVIENPSNGLVDILISLSVSAPTMPSGYTKKRRIGSIKTASSNIVAFIQNGNDFLWSAPVEDLAGISAPTSATLETLSTPLGVKTVALINTLFQNTTGGSAILIDSPDAASGGASIPGNLTNYYPSSSGGSAASLRIRTNTSSQVRVVASLSGNTLYVVTYGWVDLRGQG